jgi:hypothetical protein
MYHHFSLVFQQRFLASQIITDLFLLPPLPRRRRHHLLHDLHFIIMIFFVLLMIFISSSPSPSPSPSSSSSSSSSSFFWYDFHPEISAV